MNRSLKIMCVSAVMMLLAITAYTKPDTKNIQYFNDAKNDTISVISTNQTLLLSEESLTYTMDMLYKNPATRTIYESLRVKLIHRSKIKEFNKKGVLGSYAEIDKSLSNKYGLIIDVGKKYLLHIDSKNDSVNVYYSFYKSLGNKQILDYLVALNPKNNKYIPNFILESASYFNNPNFYIAYGDYLLQTSSKRYNEAVNFYLLGGDYTKAAFIIEQAKAFSYKQRLYVYEHAGDYVKALKLYSEQQPNDYPELYRLALLGKNYNDAYLYYLKFKPNDYTVLAQLCSNAKKYDFAIDYALKAKLDDEFMIQLYFDSNKLFDAYILSERVKSHLYDTIFKGLPDTTSFRLANYYITSKQFLKAYTIANKKLKNDSRILDSISQFTDIPTLLIDSGELINAYDYCVSSGLYLKAIDIAETNPNVNFASISITYAKAASQLAKSQSKDNLQKIIYLFDKAQDWDNAGYYSSLIPDYNKAILYYERSAAKDYHALKNIYLKIKDYNKAADCQSRIDPSDFSKIALIYEQGNIYDKAAYYFSKAGNVTMAINSALKTTPRDYKILIDMYISQGNDQKVNTYLDSLYTADPDIAGDYFKKTNNSFKYRQKSIESKKLKNALSTYPPIDSLSIKEIDEVVALCYQMGNQEYGKIYLEEKLSRYDSQPINLGEDDISEIVKIYQKMGNKAKAQEYMSIKKDIQYCVKTQSGEVISEIRKKIAGMYQYLQFLSYGTNTYWCSIFDNGGMNFYEKSIGKAWGEYKVEKWSKNWIELSMTYRFSGFEPVTEKAIIRGESLYVTGKYYHLYDKKK